MKTTDLFKYSEPRIDESSRARLTLRLEDDSHAVHAVREAVRHFVEDRRATHVRIVVPGKRGAFLSRTAVLDLASSSSGTGGGLGLPGRTRYHVWEWRCPVSQCPQRQRAATVDEKNPPKCAVHHAQRMVLVK